MADSIWPATTIKDCEFNSVTSQSVPLHVWDPFRSLVLRGFHSMFFTLSQNGMHLEGFKRSKTTHTRK